MAMTRSMRILAFVVAAAITVSAVVALSVPAAAKDVTYNLYVSGTQGWGSTNTSFSVPGPTLTVGWRDNVTLVLNATSGTGHRWFLDLNNDATRNAGEPQSPTFSAGSAAISWNFTATQNGTFVYRDRANPSLWGLVVVGGSSTSTGTSPTAPAATSDVVFVGVVAAVVAAAVGLVLGWFFGRRSRMLPPPPPS